MNLKKAKEIRRAIRAAGGDLKQARQYIEFYPGGPLRLDPGHARARYQFYKRNV